MTFFTDYFGGSRYLNLADEVKRQPTRPKSVDSNSTTRKDIKFTISELSEKDWFTFATVNLCATMFAKPRYEIISDNVETWENFFASMRDYGNNTSLRRLRSSIKRDMIKYGSGFVEFIPDETNTYIVDLKRIDASKMNNAKDGKGHLILDYLGNSIGYVLSLGANADLRSKGDFIPPEYSDAIKMNVGDIFMSPQRVAEFKLYERQNGIESIGLVEPSLQQTKRRMDLETAQVNAIWIRGTAPLFGLIGDPTHEPTPQMMEDATETLTEMKHSNVAVFPYYIEPKTLDTKVDDISTVISNNLLSASASSTGMPLPFVTGQGEATNRATLKDQRVMFEDNIQDKIKNFDEDWNLLIMDRISATNNFPKGEIKSNNIRLESADELAKRLKMYFEMRALSPKEVRMNILNKEDLITDDSDYEEFINTPEPTSVTQSYSVKGNSGSKKVANSDKNTTKE